MSQAHCRRYRIFKEKSFIIIIIEILTDEVRIASEWHKL